jgi:TRAP-type C4-dicarboxylate transport system permease small subunit
MKHGTWLTAPQSVEAGTQRFHPCVAQVMSLWCVFWLIVYGTNYVQLTWQLMSEIGGFHWILVCSPSFWCWIAVFAISVFVVERLIRITWHQFESRLNLAKVATVIFVLPFIFWCFLASSCPYLFPAVAGSLRLVPLIGGRGF